MIAAFLRYSPAQGIGSLVWASLLICAAIPFVLYVWRLAPQGELSRFGKLLLLLPGIVVSLLVMARIETTHMSRLQLEADRAIANFDEDRLAEVERALFTARARVIELEHTTTVQHQDAQRHEALSLACQQLLQLKVEGVAMAMRGY